MRTIVIGDIHGCAETLWELLYRVEPTASDRVVLLGDLFDRGRHSWEVFQTVKKLQKEHGENLILLRGNHEDYLLQESLSEEEMAVWERVGRQATVSSFRQHGTEMESAVPWLREHCRLFWKGAGFQCVHAGVRRNPIEANDIYTLIHDHDVVMENNYRVPLTIVGHIALKEPTWFQGDGRVHTLEAGKEYLLPSSGVICIDTGCGKGGTLTAMVIENDHYTFETVG